MKRSRHIVSGFTLVEIAIVLVIIGLIVGGILLGQSLIRQADIRSINTDWERFEAARHAFRDKYNCLPGDCATASQIGFGTNGNGNGYINHASTNNETWQFWRHLSRANMIEGNYTGVAGPGSSGYEAVVGMNVPAAKISNVGYTVYALSDTWANMVQFGKARNGTDNAYITGTGVDDELTRGGFLTSNETYGVDIKYDDGIGSEGKIRTSNSNSVNYGTTGCTSGNGTTYNYTRSNTAKCHIYYWWSPI